MSIHCLKFSSPPSPASESMPRPVSRAEVCVAVAAAVLLVIGTFAAATSVLGSTQFYVGTASASLGAILIARQAVRSYRARGDLKGDLIDWYWKHVRLDRGLEYHSSTQYEDFSKLDPKLAGQTEKDLGRISHRINGKEVSGINNPVTLEGLRELVSGQIPGNDALVTRFLRMANHAPFVVAMDGPIKHYQIADKMIAFSRHNPTIDLRVKKGAPPEIVYTATPEIQDYGKSTGKFFRVEMTMNLETGKTDITWTSPKSASTETPNS